MEYDIIIIGSGLSALAAAKGIPEGRSVCMISGNRDGLKSYGIDSAAVVPLKASARGGLGEFWHGVIPLNGRCQFPEISKELFVELFQEFYPKSDVSEFIDKDYVFVPKGPIRPSAYFRSMLEDRSDFHLLETYATGLKELGGSWIVSTPGGDFKSEKIVVCAGALDTPFLLKDLIAVEEKLRPSDHLIAYLGQVDRCDLAKEDLPGVVRKKEGICAKVSSSDSGSILISLKPARFEFRKLDEAIETRAAFGLPVGGVIEKLFKSMSLGLISEAVYNKYGLFPGALRYSVYGQILCQNALSVDAKGEIEYDRERTMRLIDQAKNEVKFSGFRPSNRNDFFVPGIHLHHSLKDVSELDELATRGVNVADPSTLVLSRGEHHTFFQMLKSYRLAKTLFS